MLKVALIGYGRMGQAIDSIAGEHDIEITSRVDPKHPKAQWQELTPQAVVHADVCIDFTEPKEVVGNMKILGEYGKSIVVGTTGWYDLLTQAEEVCSRDSIGIFYSDNFSIGMNLYKKIVAYAASLINEWPGYDIALMEHHHRQKLDSPSGTAKAIANILIDQVDRKKRIINDSLQRQPHDDELHVQSMRCGSIPGTHQVMIDSSADTITLTHQARNRNDFALGALTAAKWLHGRVGLFNMEDMLGGINHERT
ncbi:MAG: 4-hydroxy-tetrahydrodipicolinate reductase [Chlamydiota bacterium]